jgi:hypothetical protein
VPLTPLYPKSPVAKTSHLLVLLPSLFCIAACVRVTTRARIASSAATSARRREAARSPGYKAIAELMDPRSVRHDFSMYLYVPIRCRF